jgi:hypothetical protein
MKLIKKIVSVILLLIMIISIGVTCHDVIKKNNKKYETCEAEICLQKAKMIKAIVINYQKNSSRRLTDEEFDVIFNNTIEAVNYMTFKTYNQLNIKPMDAKYIEVNPDVLKEQSRRDVDEISNKLNKLNK